MKRTSANRKRISETLRRLKPAKRKMTTGNTGITGIDIIDIGINTPGIRAMTTFATDEKTTSPPYSVSIPLLPSSQEFSLSSEDPSHMREGKGYFQLNSDLTDHCQI